MSSDRPSPIDLAGGVPPYLNATAESHNDFGGDYFLSHTDDPRYVNVSQLAKDYGVERPTIYDWISRHYGKDYLKRTSDK